MKTRKHWDLRAHYADKIFGRTGNPVACGARVGSHKVETRLTKERAEVGCLRCKDHEAFKVTEGN